MKLIAGNKNYSSWSLRPWIALKVAGIAFDEERIPLYGPESKQRILALPAMQDWMVAAGAETESLPQFEPYG